MIGLTPEEFNQIREAIAGGHLFAQTFQPKIKQRHMQLDKGEKNLLELVPKMLAAAFSTIAQVTNRENRDPAGRTQTVLGRIEEIDKIALRDELQNVSALDLSDIEYEMRSALPKVLELENIILSGQSAEAAADRIAAIAWEAGRRYGISQAVALVHATTEDYVETTKQILDGAYNSKLDLPALSEPGAGAGLIPFEHKSLEKTAPTAGSDTTENDPDAERTTHSNKPN